MSFKSIRESYSNMLGAFGDAGVNLSESQKSELDKFVANLEENISRQRRTAVEQTRRIVESRMEKEYRQVFESIMANQAKNAELAAKIQEKVLKIDEAQKLAGKVSDYLELYLESILPRKTVVDYDRMQKLERLHESLKDMLGVDEFDMDGRMKKLEESYAEKTADLNRQLAESKKQLDASLRRQAVLKNRISRTDRQLEESINENRQLIKAQLKQAVKPVIKPVVESVKKPAVKPAVPVRRPMKQTVSEAVAPEMNRRMMKEFCGDKPEDKKLTLEKEIDTILNDDDMLAVSPHNGGGVHNGDVNTDPKRPVKEANEKFETLEEYERDSRGDIKLDESEVIDGDLMQLWCNQAVVVD